MKLMELLKAAEAEILAGADVLESCDVKRVIASDLMSDVLMMDAERPLLVTSLATDQSLRTAHVMDAVGVLIVNGKALPTSMARVAGELGLVLARTRLPKFEACVRMGRLLEPA